MECSTWLILFSFKSKGSTVLWSHPVTEHSSRLVDREQTREASSLFNAVAPQCSSDGDVIRFLDVTLGFLVTLGTIIWILGTVVLISTQSA